LRLGAVAVFLLKNRYAHNDNRQKSTKLEFKLLSFPL
jgi:hypothetical protein